MKKYLLLLSVIILGLSACKRSGDVTADQAMVDDAKIQAYLKANVPNPSIYTKDPSGIYYTVITNGTGAFPTAASTVQVAYTGKLLNGDTFDQKGNIQFSLSQVIKGWQIGIPKINKDGRIRLIIPSGLAYGATGSGSIPANGVLVFTIDLIGFFN